MRRPRPLFWVLAGAVVFIAALLYSPFVLVRFPGFSSRALDRSGLSSILAGTQRIRVERVVRFSPTRVGLRGVRVERREGQAWELWLRLGKVDLSWHPEGLIHRKVRVTYLTVDSVQVDVERMPAPIFAARKDSAGPGLVRVEKPALKLPSIACPSLRIEHVLFRGAEGRALSGSVVLTDLRHEAGTIGARLERAEAAALPESVSLVLTGGVLAGELVSSFRVDSVRVHSDGLAALLRAGWKKEAATNEEPEGGSSVEGELSIDRLAPLALAPLRRLDLPLQPEDAIRGRITFGGRLRTRRAPQLHADIDLAGTLFGHSLDSLLVQAVGSPEEATLRSLHLGYEKLEVNGTGMWRRDGASASARFTFDGLDLAAAPVALWASGLPSSRLSGDIVAQADSIGPGIRLTASLHVEPGRVLDHPTVGFEADASLDPAALTIASLKTLEPSGPSLQASGTLGRDDHLLDFAGELHEFSLADWVTPWIRVPLEGRATGSFHLAGPLEGPILEGEAAVRDGRIEGIHVDSLHVGGVRGRLSPLDLKGTLAARGLEIYTIGVDSLRGQVALGDTIRAAVTAWRDTTEVNARARILPRPRGFVWLDSLRVHPGTAPEITLPAPARLAFSPQGARVDSVRLRSEVGSVLASGEIRKDPSRSGNDAVSFRVRGDEVRLGPIVDYLGGFSQDLYGTFAFDFRGGGTVRSPEFAVNLDGSGVMVYGWLWESLVLSARAGADGGAFSMQVDSLRGRSAGYFGVLPGSEQMGPEPSQQLFVLRGDSLSLGWNGSWGETTKLLADSVELALREAEIGGHVTMTDLPVAPLLAPALSAGASQVSGGALSAPDPMLATIHEVVPAAPEGKAERATGIGGRVSLDARFAGSGGEPIVKASLRGKDLHIYQAWADSVDLHVALGDSLFTLENLDWYMGRTRLHADVSWPLTTSILGTFAVPNGPVHAKADLADADLSLVSLVTRVIKDPSGSLSGSVEVNGTPKHLVPNGELRISDGAFRVPNREERFSKIEAHLLLDSAGVHIAEAKGRLNETGKVTVTGGLRSMKDFALEAKARECPVFESGNYRFLVDADLTAQPIADGDSVRPQLSGEARVLEGLLTMNLAKPSVGQPPKTPWLIELQVLAPGNIHVNQPAANLDLGEGDLHVSFRWPYWNLSGGMQVLDGTYRIFNRAVQVTSGTIEFEDTGSGPRPVLDIQAEADIPFEPNPIHVQLSIKGRPPEPLEIALSSTTNPEMNDAELIQALSVGQLQTTQLGSFSNSDPTRQYLSSELLNQVERQLVGQLPWADRVQLLGEFGGANPMWLNVRPIVEPQWSLSIAQELAAVPGREVSVNYRLSNLFFLNAGVERRPRETSLPQDTYSLDFKFRVEY